MTATLDRTIYGADSPAAAARAHALLESHDDPYWQAGSAEPWIANLVAALIRASDPSVAIEVGGFAGYTSRVMAYALATLPHDTSLTVCEIDAQRALSVQELLDHLDISPGVRHTVVHDDSLVWIPTLKDRSVDFVWLDGSHEKVHVARELELLWPKMRSRGIIAMHDVFGVCRLSEVLDRFVQDNCNGVALDLPRLGPAGGIGIIQAR